RTALPNEVQFEIAEFLTAKDLLTARATCHKVNNALKNESARFWLYSRLRQRLRNQSNLFQSSRGYSTGLWLLNCVRQFVLEAVELVLAIVVGTSFVRVDSSLEMWASMCFDTSQARYLILAPESFF
ncbi:F-box domain, partial [Phytophthora infestans]